MASNTIHDIVLECLRNGGLSRYEISKRTGIDQGQLCRILQGQNFRQDLAQKILDLFGYEITKKKGPAR